MKQGGTQSEQILTILQSGRSLTPLEALDEVGTLRLGARIWDLKQAGHDIQTESFELSNGKRVARYWLPQPKGQLTLFGNPATTAASRAATAISPQGADHARTFQ